MGDAQDGAQPVRCQRRRLTADHPSHRAPPRAGLFVSGVVTMLLQDEEWAAWSDREIARRCAVSHRFVSTVRASILETVSSMPTQRTYTTKHGTEATMRTENILFPVARAWPPPKLMLSTCPAYPRSSRARVGLTAASPPASAAVGASALDSGSLSWSAPGVAVEPIDLTGNR